MSIRIYYSDGMKNKASVAQVETRIPRAAVGRSSREKEILDLMEAVSVVPFLAASGSVVGRGVVGPGFDIVPARIDSDGSERDKRKIVDFFEYVSPRYENIKDVFSTLAKLYTTAFSFRVFGHAAWEIVTDKKTGVALGFDVIPGVIKPNVEPDGRFRRPAYIQYLKSGSSETKHEFDDPSKIIYFAVPDFSSGIYMADMLSLAEYTLPSEIYAAMAYKSLHENRDSPYSGFWYTPTDIDDDTFDRFVAMVNARYTGSRNYGRNPIIMKGEGGFKQISVTRDDAPYVEGRAMNRDEISAASGVPTAKHGIKENADLKELRREFYESTLRPVMALLEEAIYNQVCKKLFNAPEWKFKFMRPDFTTAVEDASIELRRIQWGQWSPNEARASRGETPREGGDYYLVPANMNMVSPDGKPGRPENQPVDDNSGDMPPSEEDPVPPTMPPEPVGVEESAIIDTLRKWRRFAIRVASGKRFNRDFVPPEEFPAMLSDYISSTLDEIGHERDIVSEFFDNLIEVACGDL